jgi:OOP family OmpA-OmpF porin
MSKKRAAAAALTIFSLVSASSVMASDRGFYLGASGGQSSADFDVDFDFILADTIFPVRQSNLDSEDTGFAIFGGYRFFRYLAVEAGYLDLGKLSYTAVGSTPGLGLLPVAVGIDVETKGATGSVLGSLPLSDRFELFGRAGFLFADTEISATFSGGGFSDTASDSDNINYAELGIGAALDVQERLTFRLEYRYFEDLDNEENSLDYTSLSVVYRL